MARDPGTGAGAAEALGSTRVRPSRSRSTTEARSTGRLEINFIIQISSKYQTCIAKLSIVDSLSIRISKFYR